MVIGIIIIASWAFTKSRTDNSVLKKERGGPTTAPVLLLTLKRALGRGNIGHNLIAFAGCRQGP